MKTKLMIAAFVAAVLFAAASASAQETASPAAPESVSTPSAKKMIVLPALVTAFGKSDKFYGSNDELSRALQLFFTFTSTVMTNKEVIRANFDELLKSFPPQNFVSNQSAVTLKDRVDKSQLEAAAKAYGAQYVLFIENSKDLVKPGKQNWTMTIEVKCILFNAQTGTISDEKVYLQEEDYSFDSKKDMKTSKGGALMSLFKSSGSVPMMTFSGNMLTMADLTADPMKFGGTVTGFPFVSIAKSMAADISSN